MVGEGGTIFRVARSALVDFLNNAGGQHTEPSEQGQA
jgi:hypothetical protein